MKLLLQLGTRYLCKESPATTNNVQKMSEILAFSISLCAKSVAELGCQLRHINLGKEHDRNLIIFSDGVSFLSELSFAGICTVAVPGAAELVASDLWMQTGLFVGCDSREGFNQLMQQRVLFSQGCC